jgi:hypothetical protein
VALQVSQLPPHMQAEARRQLERERSVRVVKHSAVGKSTDALLVLDQRDRPCTLDVTIPHPPRTKKNGKENYATEKVAYRRFRAQVIDFFKRERERGLELPLADVDYIVRVDFVVDNDRVDTPGLQQGLWDALQDAGVVTNDRYLKRVEHADWREDKVFPHVALSLRPIVAGAGPGAGR